MQIHADSLEGIYAKLKTQVLKKQTDESFFAFLYNEYNEKHQLFVERNAVAKNMLNNMTKPKKANPKAKGKGKAKADD